MSDAVYKIYIDTVAETVQYALLLLYLLLPLPELWQARARLLLSRFNAIFLAASAVYKSLVCSVMYFSHIEYQGSLESSLFFISFLWTHLKDMYTELSVLCIKIFGSEKILFYKPTQQQIYDEANTCPICQNWFKDPRCKKLCKHVFCSLGFRV